MEAGRCVKDINAGDIPADMRLNGISALIRRLYNSEYEQEMHELTNARHSTSEAMRAVHVVGSMHDCGKLIAPLASSQVEEHQHWRIWFCGRNNIYSEGVIYNRLHDI